MEKGRTYQRMTWGRAWLVGLLVVSYFAFATAWLPSQLVAVLGGSPSGLAGAVGVASWAGFLGLGMAALRLAQRRGWI